MKKMFSIATALLLAGATAYAQPQDMYRGQPLRVHRAPRPYRRGYAAGYHACTIGPQGTLDAQPPAAAQGAYGWSVLGSGPLGAPSEKLMVGAQAGRFGVLRIEATSGSPLIRSIDVRFVDNTLQTLPVVRRLQPGQALSFDLGGGRAISSITVNGDPDRWSAYQLSAR